MLAGHKLRMHLDEEIVRIPRERVERGSSDGCARRQFIDSRAKEGSRQCQLQIYPTIGHLGQRSVSLPKGAGNGASG